MIFTANIFSDTVASLREQTFERNLPHPFAKVVVTHTAIYTPNKAPELVFFVSIAVYDISDREVFYAENIEAISLNLHPEPTSTSSQTQQFMSGPGYNTFHGYDTGPPPPPGVGRGMPQYSGFYQQPAMQGWPAQPVVYAQPPVVAPPAYPGYPSMHQPPPGTYPSYQSPPGNYPSYPPQPTDYPGVHLRNPTGGVGCPPGYNYLFHSENVPIHVFKTVEKPWQIKVYKEDNSTHVKLMVPCNTTVKELMQNIGCTNGDAKKNILYEVTEKGNGCWASGLRIVGDDRDRVKKRIAELGWANDRTGLPGQKPVVWLWVTKEGK